MAVWPIFTPDFPLILIFKIHFGEPSYFIFLWSVFFSRLDCLKVSF